MVSRTKVAVVIAAAAALVLGILGVGLASSGDDEAPLPGSDLDRAVSAALGHTGGGQVIETEVGDDGAAYGVEVRLDDGSVVEVELDAAFRVTGDTPDDDGAETGTDD